MRHNFDEIVNRRASDCKKYEAAAYPADVRPMGGSWYEITFQGAFTYGN